METTDELIVYWKLSDRLHARHRVKECIAIEWLQIYKNTQAGYFH